MDIEIKKIQFEVQVKPVARPDNIVAFVTWIFHTDIADISIRGGTLKRKYIEKYKKEIISYDLPAYKAGVKYYKSVYIDGKEFYKKLCMLTLQKYCQETGEVLGVYDEAEEINLDDIPL